jgi:hypothetical protein
VLVIGGDNNVAELYAGMFSCEFGKFPMMYLGVPVSYTSLKTSDWDFLDMKMIEKLDAGRVTLCLLGAELFFWMLVYVVFILIICPCLI